MNPYLERKRKLNEDAALALDAAEPVAPAPDSPYSRIASSRPVAGPELARGLAQDVDPVEQPMQPQEDRPVWSKLLNLAPAAAMAVGHLGGRGTAETRGQMNRYLEQASEQNAADTRRAEDSVTRARAYNNQILQRKQERDRQKAQDTMAAEDRTRRIGKEDTETALAAQERDPSTPKNQALRQSIAQTYPEVWAKLTPEQQANFTTGDVEALTLSIKEEDRARASKRAKEEEISKQKAEKDYFTPGGGLGGGAYAALYGQPLPGAPAPQVPGAPPTIPVDDNPYAKEILDLYQGDRSKVPATLMAQARSLYNAVQAQRPDKEVIALHDKMLDDVYKHQEDTKTRERQEKQAAEAQTKADKQQDAQYAQQRNMRSIDKVRAKLVQLKKAVAPYLDEDGNLKKGADVPGAGLTGNLPDAFQLALTKDGKQIMRLKDELLDTRLREATGANAPPSELKQFRKLAGIGTWDTDEDMIAGLNNAEAILDEQEAYLDANFVDASIRFHDRVKERDAKKVEAKAPVTDYTKLQGYTPPNAP